MWFMLSVLRFPLICCFMLTVFLLCATICSSSSVWYYLDVLMYVSVYINFYSLSFSFLFILFSWYFLWILWSDSNEDGDICYDPVH